MIHKASSVIQQTLVWFRGTDREWQNDHCNLRTGGDSVVRLIITLPLPVALVLLASYNFTNVWFQTVPNKKGYSWGGRDTRSQNERKKTAKIFRFVLWILYFFTIRRDDKKMNESGSGRVWSGEWTGRCCELISNEEIQSNRLIISFWVWHCQAVQNNAVGDPPNGPTIGAFT